MNFDRDRGIGAACLFFLALLTLSSCGGNQSTSQTTTSPSQTTSPSATTSTADTTSLTQTTAPSATTSTADTTSPSPSSTSGVTSPDESTSPEASTTTEEVKPQGTRCPEDAPIKGKISKRGKIYHLPNTSSYKAIKPNACFSSVTAAQKAGFRAPGRRRGQGEGINVH